MIKNTLVFSLTFIITFVMSCKTKDKKENMQDELKNYFNQYGNGVGHLIHWIDNTIKVDRSYIYNYRVRSNKVFCYYLDSGMRRDQYFDPVQDTPDSLLTVLEKSTISNVIKFHNKDYYQIEIAAFSSYGYNIQILYFVAGGDHNDEIDKINRFILKGERPFKGGWMYKVDNNFIFIISNLNNNQLNDKS